jgi:8-oxo-dGTP pyrophosphatase MutT (NUDIX family)
MPTAGSQDGADVAPTRSGSHPPPPDPRITALRAAIAAHVPGDAAEHRSCDQTLQALEVLASPFDQHADPTHVTGSAIVTDGAGQVVLHRHKRLGIWLQPGGHVDPGEQLAAAAVRETREETGLSARHPAGGPDLLHVDVHPGPRGHRHLDIRFLLVAEADQPLAPADGESPEVAWFTLAAAHDVADASLAAAIAALERR